MDNKGRKRTPTTFKVLRGTLRADRMNPNEPTPDVVRLEAPAWLSERALGAFNDLSTLFYAQGILTQLDAMALTLLCDQWHDYREARAFIDEHGQYDTHIDKMGNTVIKNYPQMSTLSTAFSNILRLLTEFGATPASRSKVSSLATAEIDPLDELINLSQQARQRRIQDNL